MGLSDTIATTGRYSLRWPGWAAFWRPLKAWIPGRNACARPGERHRLAPGFHGQIPGPRLVYQDNEKDLVAMLNIFEGTMAGKKTRLTSTLYIERDLDTGLMAMSKGCLFRP